MLLLLAVFFCNNYPFQITTASDEHIHLDEGWWYTYSPTHTIQYINSKTLCLVSISSSKWTGSAEHEQKNINSIFFYLGMVGQPTEQNQLNPFSGEYDINTNSAIAFIPMILLLWFGDDGDRFSAGRPPNSTHYPPCAFLRGMSSIKEEFAHLL